MEISNTAELKKELTKLKKDYSKFAERLEKNCIDNLDYESVEYYAYLGKIQLCEDLLKKFSK